MLNPWLLLFLPLAAVPVILHLITLHRLRTVELSTFRFLMDSYVQQRRRMKLLEFLLMILRTLFVALIIVALSRPEVSGFAKLLGSGSGRDVAVIVDASPGMALRSAGTTSLERARSAARNLIERLEDDDHVTLVRAAGEPEVLWRGYAGNVEPIIGKLDDLTTAAVGADLPRALAQAFRGRRHGPRVVYLISDSRRTTWNRLRDHPVLGDIEPDARVIVLDVGSLDAAENLAVIGDPPGQLRPVVGLPVLLSATVLYSGASEASSQSDAASPRRADATLKVILDEQEVAQVTVPVQPGRRVQREVSVTPARPGLVQGRFELARGAARDDAFADDDAFLFTLNVEPALRVLLVSGSKAKTPQEDPAVFLSAALRAPLETRLGISEQVRQLATALEVTTLKPQQLTAAALAGADVAILSDVTLNAKQGELLRDYLNGGGGLLLLPGPTIDPNNWQQHLLGGDAAPLELLPLAGDPDDESAFMTVAPVDFAHPVFSAFASERSDYFSMVRLYRYLPMKITAARPAATALTATRPQSLLRLPDQSSVLVELAVGEGRLLLAGFSASPQWSNLPLKPEFVPILLRAVAHLRRSAPVRIAPGLHAGEIATLHVSGQWPGAEAQAIGPDGKASTIELHRKADGRVGALTDVQRRGYYRFVVSPRAQDGPGPIERGFAVNLDADQADFARLDSDEIQALFGERDEGNVVVVASSADDPVFKSQLTSKREIWRVLIWVTFIVIGIEFLLATLRPGDDAAEASPRLRVMRWLNPIAALTPAVRRSGAAATSAEPATMEERL